MKRKKRIKENDKSLTNKYMLLYGEEEKEKEKECKILYNKLNELIENINTKVIHTKILNIKKLDRVSYNKKNCEILRKHINEKLKFLINNKKKF
jgi:hypothetical protein